MMVSFSFLLTSALLVFPAAVVVASGRHLQQEQPELLDLYIRERYVTGEDGREPCSFCGQRDGCYLAQRNFYIQGECRNRGSTRSALYGDVVTEDGKTVVCRQDFDGSCATANPTFTATSAADCGQNWTLDGCDTEQSLEMIVARDWCIKAASRSIDDEDDEYVMPFMTLQIYETSEDCPSDNFNSRLMPNDPDLCSRVTLGDDDTGRFYGSQITYCNESKAVHQVFSDRECRVPAPSNATTSSLDGATLDCPTDVATDDFAVTSNCTPKYFCKNFYTMRFSMQRIPPSGDVAPLASSTISSLKVSSVALFASAIAVRMVVDLAS